MRAAVTNARAWLALREQDGGPSGFLWSFAPDQPVARPRPASSRDLPATTPESDRMSLALKRLGFTFVGSTICYALMQSVGMADDHAASCHRALAAGRK